MRVGNMSIRATISIKLHIITYEIITMSLLTPHFKPS